MFAAARAFTGLQCVADGDTPARNGAMNDDAFEGTLVLERLAEMGRVEAFFEAVDSDDVARAVKLMKRAQIDASTIAVVVRKIEDSDGEH
jgi:hypothetical protein